MKALLVTTSRILVKPLPVISFSILPTPKFKVPLLIKATSKLFALIPKTPVFVAVVPVILPSIMLLFAKFRLPPLFLITDSFPLSFMSEIFKVEPEFTTKEDFPFKSNSDKVISPSVSVFVAPTMFKFLYIEPRLSDNL